MSHVNRRFKCFACGHEWNAPHGSGRQYICPKCGNKNIHRAPQDRGYARLGRGRRGHSDK